MSPNTFRVLKLNEDVMFRLRLYTQKLSNPANDFSNSVTTYYILVTMVAFVSTSAAFVYQNTSNIVIALQTAMITIGTSQALGMFLCVGCKIDKVKMLHLKLQSIVDQAAKGLKRDRIRFLSFKFVHRKLDFSRWLPKYSGYVLEMRAKVFALHHADAMLHLW